MPVPGVEHTHGCGPGEGQVKVARIEIIQMKAPTVQATTMSDVTPRPALALAGGVSVSCAVMRDLAFWSVRPPVDLAGR